MRERASFEYRKCKYKVSDMSRCHDGGKDKPAKFTPCEAFMDIREKLNSLRRNKMDIKDFPHITHGVFLSAGIPDDNPSIIESERYLELDAHWSLLRTHMLEIMDQWHEQVGAKEKEVH
jgi:hypothetical protein